MTPFASRKASERTYTEKDMADAFREGWKQRDRTIGIVQPTRARDEFYGTARRAKATARPSRYHASLFTAWLKDWIAP